LVTARAKRSVSIRVGVLPTSHCSARASQPCEGSASPNDDALFAGTSGAGVAATTAAAGEGVGGTATGVGAGVAAVVDAGTGGGVVAAIGESAGGDFASGAGGRPPTISSSN